MTVVDLELNFCHEVCSLLREVNRGDVDEHGFYMGVSTLQHNLLVGITEAMNVGFSQKCKKGVIE